MKLLWLFFINAIGFQMFGAELEAQSEPVYATLNRPKIRISYESSFTGEPLEQQSIFVESNGEKEHVFTVPASLRLEPGVVYRVDPVDIPSTLSVITCPIVERLRFFYKNGDSEWYYPIYCYDPQTQSRVAFDSARAIPLWNNDKPLTAMRFIIGKIYPDSIDSPLYVAISTKFGESAPSAGAISSPAILRRQISAIAALGSDL